MKVILTAQFEMEVSSVKEAERIFREEKDILNAVIGAKSAKIVKQVKE